MRERIENVPKLTDYAMNVSADSEEELDETIEEHRKEGWVVVKRIRSSEVHRATLRKR